MVIRRVLADNIQALMDHASAHGGKYPSQYTLGKVKGVSQSTVSRIMNLKVSVTIDVLQVIANAYGLQASQLLTPGLDPGNPPQRQHTRRRIRRYKRDQPRK